MGWFSSLYFQQAPPVPLQAAPTAVTASLPSLMPSTMIEPSGTDLFNFAPRESNFAPVKMPSGLRQAVSVGDINSSQFASRMSAPLAPKAEGFSTLQLFDPIQAAPSWAMDKAPGSSYVQPPAFKGSAAAATSWPFSEASGTAFVEPPAVSTAAPKAPLSLQLPAVDAARKLSTDGLVSPAEALAMNQTLRRAEIKPSKFAVFSSKANDIYHAIGGDSPPATPIVPSPPTGLGGGSLMPNPLAGGVPNVPGGVPNVPGAPPSGGGAPMGGQKGGVNPYVRTMYKMQKTYQIMQGVAQAVPALGSIVNAGVDVATRAKKKDDDAEGKASTAQAGVVINNNPVYNYMR